MRARLAGALALLLTACRAAPASFEDLREVLNAGLDAMRAAGVRSVALEERFLLYSPYEPARTQRYVGAANGALDDLEQGLGVPFGPPVIVVLVPRPVEGAEVTVEGDQLRFEGAPERPSDHGVMGVAGSSGERDAVVVYVPADRVSVLADGRKLTGGFAFPEDLEVLRHELAHVAAARAGLEGSQWLDEGLALLFEHGRMENGVLVTDRGAPELAAAREHFAETSLSELLAWEEDQEDRVAGRVWRTGRPLTHALAVYVVESGQGSMPERVRRLAALSEADLLALEPEWRAWMTAGMPALAPAP
jgi:hypothetical protein